MENNYTERKYDILLVEDNLTNTKLAEIFLREFNYTYKTAANGKEALEELKTNKFSIILLDIEMPILNGKETLKKLRSGDAGTLNQETPAIAMTAHTSISFQELSNIGFNEIITKPVDYNNLPTRIEKYL